MKHNSCRNGFYASDSHKNDLAVKYSSYDVFNIIFEKGEEHENITSLTT